MSDCYTCGGVAIPVSTGTYNGVQTLSHGECEGITIDLLNMFLRLLTCVKTNNLYSAVNTSEGEINNGSDILNAWITAKQQDPATCQYQEKLPLIQAIVTRIVAYGRC